jgi:hypothetical protein
MLRMGKSVQVNMAKPGNSGSKSADARFKKLQIAASPH